MYNKKFDVELVLPEETAAQALRNNASSTSSSEKNGKSAPPPSSVGELQRPESVALSSFASDEVGFCTPEFVNQEGNTHTHCILWLLFPPRQMAGYRQRYDELVTFTVSETFLPPFPPSLYSLSVLSLLQLCVACH